MLIEIYFSLGGLSWNIDFLDFLNRQRLLRAEYKVKNQLTNRAPFIGFRFGSCLFRVISWLILSAEL